MLIPFLFLLLSTANGGGNPNRRILHQPFFPQDSTPPPQLSPPPPSQPPPSPPNLPFSNSAPTQSPFFPSYPSPPSPPPPTTTFASFPANISSLVIPQQTPSSKPSSPKLLFATISAVVSAILLLSLLAVFYSRRRGRSRRFSDECKAYGDVNGDYSNAVPVTATANRHKLRTSSTSSEFLYLGNIVNSHTIDDPNHSNVGSDPRKLDSPELRPLPPLNKVQNCEVGSVCDVGSEEEFYSPRGSFTGRESSTGTGTGSGSMRVFNAVNGGDFRGGCSESSSSYSSSSSASPARSQSLSISPPVSVSPTRAKSPPPESHLQELSPSPTCSPPMVPLHNEREQKSFSSVSAPPSRRLSSQFEPKLVSPSLSPARILTHYSQSSGASSPERDVEIKNEASLCRNSNDLDQIMSAKSDSSITTSPMRGSELRTEASPCRKPNDFDQSRNSQSISSLYSSPERNVELKSEACTDMDQNTCSQSLFSLSPSSERNVEISREESSFRHSNDSDPTMYSQSQPLSSFEKTPPLVNDFNRFFQSPALSSPEKVFEENPFVSNHSARSSSVSSASTSPGRLFQKSYAGYSPIKLSSSGLNAKISSVLEENVSAAPAPPPPPPPPPPAPLMVPQSRWSSLMKATPTNQPIMQPPELIPPSRPFVLQSTTKVSPMELPPSSDPGDGVEETPKLKLKPLHWDKVRASSDREMVWDQLRSSSFKLNEEMIETLFVVNNSIPKPKQTTPRAFVPAANQENRVLDPKKAQNIAILLRALNVTIEEVCDALLEGNADTLGTELLESLLKMAPTKEEERMLKEYKDDSPNKLGQAEKFLKAVLDVPYAFKRVDAMLNVANFESEVEYLKRSFETLESACEELRNSRMFFKLLEAVLKTGNRMNVGTNRGDAQAFKLDTLLKLVDVKGADGKTTLLHFVVQEIIRAEGARLTGTNQTSNSASVEDTKCRKLGLQVVSGLSSELTNVKKAAGMDFDVLSGDLFKLSKGIQNISQVVRLNEALQSDANSQKFSESMNRFMKMAEEEIFKLQAHESVAMSLVKEITEYFHGNSAREEAHPFRIFMVVSDFLGVLDRVCKEVGMINERTIVSSAHKFPVPVNPTIPQGFYASNTRGPCSSCEDECECP